MFSAIGAMFGTIGSGMSAIVGGFFWVLVAGVCVFAMAVGVTGTTKVANNIIPIGRGIGRGVGHAGRGVGSIAKNLANTPRNVRDFVDDSREAREYRRAQKNDEKYLEQCKKKRQKVIRSLGAVSGEISILLEREPLPPAPNFLGALNAFANKTKDKVQLQLLKVKHKKLSGQLQELDDILGIVKGRQEEREVKRDHQIKGVVKDTEPSVAKQVGLKNMARRTNGDPEVEVVKKQKRQPETEPKLGHTVQAIQNPELGHTAQAIQNPLKSKPVEFKGRKRPQRPEVGRVVEEPSSPVLEMVEKQNMSDTIDIDIF